MRTPRYGTVLRKGSYKEDCIQETRTECPASVRPPVIVVRICWIKVLIQIHIEIHDPHFRKYSPTPSFQPGSNRIKNRTLHFSPGKAIPKLNSSSEPDVSAKTVELIKYVLPTNMKSMIVHTVTTVKFACGLVNFL